MPLGTLPVMSRAAVTSEKYTPIAIALHRRTHDAAEGAEDAAVPGIRSQQHLAARTFVEEPACVCRHREFVDVPTVRAGEA